MATDFELHLERDLDVPYETAQLVLRAGPRQWLPGFAQEGERPTAELAFEQGGRRVTRRVEVELGTVQTFAYGVSVRIDWEGARHPQLYPRLEGHLRLERRPHAGSTLRFDASYAPPAGRLGAAADRAVMHHVAESSVTDFVDRVAALLVRGADTTSSSPGGPARQARQYRPSRGRRVGDAIISVFIRAGLVPSSYLLTTRGRKTGRLRTCPVTVVEHDGKRWLVAPYGPVSWVRNVRAAGQVSLRRRLDTRAYTVREVTSEEAGPVLKRYVGIATATRPYFQATKNSPVGAFVAEAERHPVFELTPTTRDRPSEHDER